MTADHDDLPDDARRALEGLRRDDDRARAALDREVSRIREQAEARIADLRATHDQEARARAQRVIDGLEKAQRKAMEQADLDGALAIYALRKELARTASDVAPDPGSLSGYTDRDGDTLRFAVRGSTEGAVWGSGPYTLDSHLATAAVHAGAVAAGADGVVTVRIVGGERGPFRGSHAHGVRTDDWTSYDGAFHIV